LGPYHARMPPKPTVAPKRKRAAPKKAARAKAVPQSPRLPVVKLGRLAANGIAASIYVLIERGAAKRPKVVKNLRGTMELRFKEDYAPVRVLFSPAEILVEDGFPPAEGETPVKPDLLISGSLPEVVQLASAPLVGGLPKPTDTRGRAALANVAAGKVKIEGSPLLARRVLKLFEI
jgi:hypothetical protein